MEAAIKDAGLKKSDIGYINLHGTSTPVGDAIELKAALSVCGDKIPPFSSTKSMTGHALGAAGSQEAIFCMLMMRDGFFAPNINLEKPDEMVGSHPIVRETQKADFKFALSNSFGFGGTNCSLVIAKEPF